MTRPPMILQLSFHAMLAWLAKAIKADDDIGEALPDEETMNSDSNDVDSNLDCVDTSDDDDANNDDYNVTIGNEGLVLVNVMTDYLNRGRALRHLCIWDYCTQVSKYKLNKKEQKEFDKTKAIPGKRNTTTFKYYLFEDDHPQSESYWQRQRLKGSFPVPCLSKLPPSSKSDQLRFQKCILLLFKPFVSFDDLYNGISWSDTYDEFLVDTDKQKYILNIEELHKGIEDDLESNERPRRQHDNCG